MKKLIFFILLLITSTCYSQVDFDFTVETRHYNVLNKKDTLASADYFIPTRFCKVDTILIETSASENNIDSSVYTLQYIGFTTFRNNPMLCYLVTRLDGIEDKELILYVNPMLPLFIFIRKNMEFIYN